MQETPVQFLGWEDPLEKGQATHSSVPGLPLWLNWQKICLQCRRPGFNPWVGKIPWRRKGCPLQYYGLENSMDCIFHGVAKSWTRLSNLHFSLHLGCQICIQSYSQYSFICLVSAGFVVMFPLLLLVLVICVFSHFFLVSLACSLQLK